MTGPASKNQPHISVAGNTFHRPRWASLAKKALGTAVVMGVLGAGSAQALVVTVDNQQWDVTTFKGKYNNNIELLQRQVWWGNQDTAEKFASAVGNGLNFPNRRFIAGPQGTAGPFFAFSEVQFGKRLVNRSAEIKIAGISFTSPSFPVSRSTNLTWATATRAVPGATATRAVPGPLPILGVAAAFGFSRKLRKRIKLHKGTSDISSSAGA